MFLCAEVCRTVGGRKVSVQRVTELPPRALKEVFYPNL